MLDTLKELKEHSILDNILTFWEAVPLARMRREEMVVVFLDFDKAYDCVDWSFLEGTLTGFPSQMRGSEVWQLYTSMHIVRF